MDNLDLYCCLWAEKIRVIARPDTVFDSTEKIDTLIGMLESPNNRLRASVHEMLSETDFSTPALVAAIHQRLRSEVTPRIEYFLLVAAGLRRAANDPHLIKQAFAFIDGCNHDEADVKMKVALFDLLRKSDPPVLAAALNDHLATLAIADKTRFVNVMLNGIGNQLGNQLIVELFP